MHELGLCEDVVAAVARRADGRPVTAVGVRIGAVHRVEPEAFRLAFALVAPGSVADGASVDIVTVPLHASCRACGEEFTTDEFSPACRTCASMAVDTHGGDELTLEWLQYRDA